MKTDEAQYLHTRLQQWRSAVDAEMSMLLPVGDPAFLHEPMSYALQAQGKRLRPALCFACTEALGEDWQAALPAAVALEIFHTFTLVHDDIMDGDKMRRGQATVHTAFDLNKALLAGDALMIKAYEQLTRLPAELQVTALQLLNQGAMDVCIGQAWDMQFEETARVEHSEYESMVDAKTGALIRLASSLGALLGGGTKQQVQHLSDFGLLLGRAFQLQDDLLEITSTAEVMGKSLGSDIVNQKKTWLMLDLFERISEHEQQDLRSQVRDLSEIGEILGLLRQWMQEKGTLKAADKQISNWIEASMGHIHSARLKEPEVLQTLAQFILSRNH